MTDLPEPDYYGLTPDHLWMSIDANHAKRLKPEFVMRCYTSTQMREYRNAALEEAARVCEQTEIVTYIYGTQVHDSGAETLSNAINAIRSLKGN